MARPRKRLPWAYDDKLQQFTTPAGVVTLKELAELRHGLLTSHFDLRGPWTGFRVQGSLIVSKHGRLRPETAAQFVRWLGDMQRQEMAPSDRPKARRPALRLVYSADSA